MLWRRKSDGFDWHKHVRTTIKLRREARRQKLDDAVDVALGGIKGAGKAGVSAGASGIDAVNKAVAAPFVWLGRGIAAALGWLSGVLARALAPAGRLTERRGSAPILGLVAVVAGLLGLGRAQVEGWDTVALVLALGAVALIVLVLGPPVFAGRGSATLAALSGKAGGLWQKVPGLGGLGLPVQRGMTALGIVAVVGVGGWLGARAISALPPSTLAAIPGLSRPAIEGVASVTGGDTFRLNGQSIRLAGIEAPEIEQRCGGQGRESSWRCGEAARKELRDLVRNKQMRCEIGGVADNGAALGTCRIGTLDVAAELVTRGTVFAQAGLFSSYGRLEQDARNAKRGLWRGTAERPEDYRARLWESARKNAPQGCPIKGQIARSERVYVVPWEAGYSRVRIRADKGERWFCSEREARDAGWKRQGV
jgi:endonuclease YncB( thermonuclease family)